MTESGAAPPPRAERRATLRVIQVFAALYALAVFAQAILAGAFMAGQEQLVTVHGTFGSVLLVVPLGLTVAAVLHFRPGRGPWWPIPVAAVLLCATQLQVGMGYALIFVLHIPLAFVLFGVGLWLAVWSGDRARRLAKAGR